MLFVKKKYVLLGFPLVFLQPIPCEAQLGQCISFHRSRYSRLGAKMPGISWWFDAWIRTSFAASLTVLREKANCSLMFAEVHVI